MSWEPCANATSCAPEVNSQSRRGIPGSRHPPASRSTAAIGAGEQGDHLHDNLPCTCEKEVSRRGDVASRGAKDGLATWRSRRTNSRRRDAGVAKQLNFKLRRATSIPGPQGKGPRGKPPAAVQTHASVNQSLGRQGGRHCSSGLQHYW